MLDNDSIRTTTLQDVPVIYELLRSQNKEAYMIRNERAWRTISKMFCQDSDYQLSIVYQVDGKVVGFYSAITDPRRFWKTFIRRYGFFRFFWEKFRQTAELLQEKSTNGTSGNTESAAEGLSIDQEFLAKSHKRYESVPGIAYLYFIYVDSNMGRRGIGRKLVQEMGDRLKSLGFQMMEGEILTANEISKRLFLASGFEIRFIGDMWYMVKRL